MKDSINGIKTKKGRVVYDRQRNPFSVSDFLRISKKLSVERYKAGSESFDEILQIVRGSNPVGPSGIIFGGGSFGGAGASRSFYDGNEIGRMILIMEEK